MGRCNQIDATASWSRSQDLREVSAAKHEGFRTPQGPRSGDPNVAFALKALGQEETPLNARFFSAENMNVVQAMLAQRVLETTGHRISRQDDRALSIIMHRLYADHAHNNWSRIEEQVATLNELVVQRCAPMVAEGIRMYLVYLRDISSLPVPLERSENVSSTGVLPVETHRGLQARPSSGAGLRAQP